ncbi:MAG: hypothetical protein EXS05_03725 [Planctomycetaceae bacterium]|nr:hypothetical protein [Planctomycetaceae bacterium]
MPKTDRPTSATTPGARLAQDLIDQVDELLLTADQSGKPLELDPYRGRLFELFVMAEASGFLEEGADRDLTCDGIGRELSARWNLAKKVGGNLSQTSSLPEDQLAKVRLLWSFMRMWMEWTYAWRRWREFHQSQQEGASH